MKGFGVCRIWVTKMNNQFIPEYYAQKVGLLNFPGFKAYYRFQPNEDKPISFEDVIASINSVAKRKTALRLCLMTERQLMSTLTGAMYATINYNKSKAAEKRVRSRE